MQKPPQKRPITRWEAHTAVHSCDLRKNNNHVTYRALQVPRWMELGHPTETLAILTQSPATKQFGGTDSDVEIRIGIYSFTKLYSYTLNKFYYESTVYCIGVKGSLCGFGSVPRIVSTRQNLNDDIIRQWICGISVCPIPTVTHCSSLQSRHLRSTNLFDTIKLLLAGFLWSGFVSLNQYTVCNKVICRYRSTAGSFHVIRVLYDQLVEQYINMLLDWAMPL